MQVTQDSAQGQGGLSVEENKALVRASLEAVSEGRLDDAWALMSEDAVWTAGGHSPLTGDVTKAQQVEQIIDKVYSELTEASRSRSSA
jgi:ketosteroid isomerase-like protein